MQREFTLGEFEQMILLAILQLGSDAYGPSISAYLEREVGRRVSRGGLYSSLGRLEEKGFLHWSLEPPGDGRGGHRRRRFVLTESGLEALRSYRSALRTLWSGLEGVLG